MIQRRNEIYETIAHLKICNIYNIKNEQIFIRQGDLINYRDKMINVIDTPTLLTLY